MRYAVITEGTVTNVITLWETNAGDFPGAVALHDRPVGIGDTYSESKFWRDGEELLTSDEKIVAMQTAAVAVLEKVKLGRMTSSPGWRPHSSIAISSAVVPLVVSSTFWVWKRSSSQLLHILVKAPSPQILWASMACFTYSNSSPTQGVL